MMNKKWIILGIILVLITAGSLVFWYSKGKEKGISSLFEKEKESREISEKESIFDQEKFERSKEIAQKAVENSPTYKFDGYDLKFESSETLSCVNCWEFVFSFSSRHAGYGNRRGQMLAQVITPHQIRVDVDNEKVVAMVTDRTFDEINQVFLK